MEEEERNCVCIQTWKGIAQMMTMTWIKSECMNATISMYSDLIQVIVIIWAILVLIAYNKWATNQSTGKKAPYWAFYDELKVIVGNCPPIWRCAGCHPVASAALALYAQKKELKAMPKGLVRYG